MPQKSGEPLKLSLLTLEGAQPSRAECVDPFKVSSLEELDLLTPQGAQPTKARCDDLLPVSFEGQKENSLTAKAENLKGEGQAVPRVC